MGSTTSNLIVRIQAETSQMSKDLKKAQGAMAKFQSTVKRIGVTVAAAFATDKIVRFATESAKLAMEAEGVKTAFNKLDGVSLANLRRQTQGTFSDLQLMKSAVEFGNFNLPLNQLGTLLQFVQMRAAQTGKSFEHLRDSLVEGLAKESKLRIDNLGISLKDLNKEIVKTGNFTTAVSNIAEREIGEMAGVTDTSKTSLQQLNASWENFQTAIGTAIVQGAKLSSVFEGVSRAISDTAAQIKYANGAFINMEDELITLNTLLGNYNKGGIWDKILGNTILPHEVDDVNKRIDELTKSLNLMNDAAQPLAQNWEKLLQRFINDGAPAANTLAGMKEELKTLREEFDLIPIGTQKFYNMRKEIELLSEKIRQLTTATKEYTASAPGLLYPKGGTSHKQTAGLPQAPVLGEIRKISPELMTLEERLKAVGMVAVEYGGMIAGAVGGIAEAFGNAIGSGQNFGKALIQVFAGFMKQLGQMMIATGLATEKFKNFLMSKPIAAVGAGIALVAIASAFQSAASGLVSNLGSGGGGGGSRRSQPGGNAGGVLSNKFVFEISGRVLKENYDYHIKRQSYTGGRG